MLRNHLLVALRKLRRQKGYAALNVVGLGLGLACCLLIGLYVREELAFDRFHAKADRTYRLVSEGDFSAVGWPYGRILEAEYPEVEEVVYLRTWPTFSIAHDGEHLFERMLYADAGFFRVFDFPLVEGDPATALAEPYTLVLSEALAERLYGGAPALGRTLTLDDTLQFAVTGVARVPARSHVQFDALLSFETLRALDPAWFERELTGGWLNLNVSNYVLLREGADAAAFAAKVRDLPQERAGEALRAWGSALRLGLEPLTGVYLHSDLGNPLGPKSDVAYVYLLGAVGLFVLLIAGVNFVNLATARSAERAREVGVRKVAGSSRCALVGQFLVESGLTALAAGLLAVGLAALALPFFNGLADRAYAAADLFAPGLVAGLVGLVAVAGLLAGLYPAFALSAFRPAEVLKGRFATGRRGVRLRQGLVVLQFALSAVLLVATLVVLRQVRHMQAQDLGFDAEQVLVLDARRAPGQERVRRTEAFKQALAAHPAVERVSATAAVPGRSGWRGQISFPEGLPEGQSVSLEYVPIDHDYVGTVGLEIVAGRDLDAAFATDAETAVLINEAAVAVGGWASPREAVGKRFTSPGSGKPDGVVVGVVADYHHHGLQERVGPMMYGVGPGGLFALRIGAAEAAAVRAHVERTWAAFFEGYPSESFFLDDDFARQYERERRLTRIFGTFAALAVLVACLGLFGLAAFAAQQRTKEVGIRKVLGASVAEVVALLSKDFLRLVGLALLLAFPVAYWAMSRWLEGFAYRVGLGPEVFLGGGALLLLIALLTVSGQALRAATSDPVKALRHE